MTTRLEAETFGGGHRGILIAMCFRAAKELTATDRMTREIYPNKSMDEVRDEAEAFFVDELFDAVCFHLDMDADYLRSMLGVARAAS